MFQGLMFRQKSFGASVSYLFGVLLIAPFIIPKFYILHFSRYFCDRSVGDEPEFGCRAWRIVSVSSCRLLRSWGLHSRVDFGQDILAVVDRLF